MVKHKEIKYSVTATTLAGRSGDGSYREVNRRDGWFLALLGHYTENSGNSVTNSWPLKMGPIYCPETPIRYYHSRMRNTPGERRSNLHSGGSLNSCRWDGCFLGFDTMQDPTLTPTLPRNVLPSSSSKRWGNVQVERWNLPVCYHEDEDSTALPKRRCQCPSTKA